MATKLIIVGLRRSGTTIFWQTIRQDRRFLCFDEPFNPLLHVMPDGSPHKNPEEFQALVERDARAFWEHFTPIHFSEELREGLSDRHRAWFNWLSDQNDRVMMDVTRCQFKLEALHALAPDATVVHLYRPASAFVTSHMLPSSKDWKARARKAYYQSDFWTRTDRYDFWSMQSVVGTAPNSLFGLRLNEIGLEAQSVFEMPAVQRLLALWRLNYERAEADGRRLFGNRFISQGFNAFAQSPAPVIERLYEVMGESLADFDYRRVHAPNPAHQADSDQWLTAAEAVGLSRDLL